MNPTFVERMMSSIFQMAARSLHRNPLMYRTVLNEEGKKHGYLIFESDITYPFFYLPHSGQYGATRDCDADP